MTRRLACVALALAGLASACSPRREADAIATLVPDPNPIGPSDPLFSPTPHRERPRAMCASKDGAKAWVMLGGTEDDPGDSIAVVDLASERVTSRVLLAPSPWDCALDPSSRYLVVLLRTSDHAIVLDARTDEEVARVAVPYYTEHAAFRPDGKRVYLANRWKDSVLWWDVDLDGGFDVRATSYDGALMDDDMGTPVTDNPTTMAFSSDGARLFVGSATGCSISVLDGATGALVDADGDPATTTVGAPKGVSFIDLHSPVGGLAVSGRHLFVADMGKGLGAQPALGLDLDEDGHPGDGTANQSFQDSQNEIGVFDTDTLEELHRYTSDTICCMDFRDVDPEHPEKGRGLPDADKWEPDVVSYLPPRSRWIVAGALPEAMAVQGDTLWVAFSASNEVQGFAIGADGALSPLEKAGGLFRTGYNPKAIAVAGSRVVTVDRLGESLTLFDPAVDRPGSGEQHVVVGDVAAGPFPQTDAELGEGINEMTAAFTIDGDQACVQCHRDNGSIARPFVMPLQSSRAWSLRNVMAQRGLYDTRPWFFESAMDETNFFPVLNEFARKENFCCEGSDPFVWGKYPKVEDCVASPGLAGCHHVLHCDDDPPPECATRPYARTPFLRRSAFIKDAAKRLFGRDTTFGDALYATQPDGTRTPLDIDFDGMTRAVGLFMLRTPRLLPNPNRAMHQPTARRGEALFTQPGTGCASCHPLPRTTTATLPTAFSPFGMPVRFPPVISPERRPDGTDAMLVTQIFIDTFPQTVQGPEGLHIGSTPLRGLWDRPRTRLYHDGRARSLREALATPGHPALLPGEIGRNERDGVFDTHGGTSQLDPYQLQDLINYLLTL